MTSFPSPTPSSPGKCSLKAKLLSAVSRNQAENSSSDDSAQQNKQNQLDTSTTSFTSHTFGALSPLSSPFSSGKAAATIPPSALPLLEDLAPETLEATATCLSCPPLVGVSEQATILLTAIERISSEPQAPAEAVLLIGPSGTGKTELIRQVLQEREQIFWGSGMFLAPAKRGEKDDGFCSIRDDTTLAAETVQSSSLLYDGASVATGQYTAIATTTRPTHQPPFAALIEAFTTILDQIVHSAAASEVRDCVQAFLSLEELTVIGWVIPAVQELIPDLRGYSTAGGSDDEFEVDETDSEECQADRDPVQQQQPNGYTFRLFRSLFRRFVMALSSPQHPVVLVLDDWQWADSESRTLIMSLLVGRPALYHFLLLGTVRDEGKTEAVDQKWDQKRYWWLRNQPKSSSSTMPLTKIHQTLLTEDQLHVLILHVLEIDADTSTQELASLVFHRTAGNPLFAIQFVDLLFRQGFLKELTKHQQLTSNRAVQQEGQKNKRVWEWDLQDIADRTEMLDDVVDLLTSKISLLPSEVQLTLILASILGFSFSVEVLECIVGSVDMVSLFPTIMSMLEDENIVETSGHGSLGTDPKKKMSRQDLCSIDIRSCLQQAQEAGLVEPIATNPSTDQTPSAISKYKFSHVRVQESANSLLPLGEDKDRLKGLMGEAMLGLLKNYEKVDSVTGEKYTDNSGVWLLFAATNLVLDSSSSLSLKDVAELCLRASKSASQSAAFATAAQYADAGVKRLEPKTIWRRRDDNDHYKLTLELYNTSAETHFAYGAFRKCERRISSIRANARKVEDCFRAWKVQLNIHFAREEWERCTDEGRLMLDKLGVETPKRINNTSAVRAVAKSKKLLKGRSPTVLEHELPLINDPKVDQMVSLLAIMSITAYKAGNSNLCAALFNIQFQLLLTYGICNTAAFGMMSYASTLSILNEGSDAREFAKYALRLLDRPNQAEYVAPVLVAYYHIISHLHEPLRENLLGVRRGIVTGLRCGDVLSASVLMETRASTACIIGMRLPDLAREISGYHQFMQEHKQKSSMSLLACYTQYVDNLLGNTDDPLQTSDILSGRDSNKPTLYILRYHFIRMVLLYTMKAFTVADEERIENEKSYDAEGGPSPTKLYFFCIAALNCYALARQGKNARLHSRKAKWYIKALQPMVKAGTPMLKHFLLLIEAERLALERKPSEKVSVLFEEAFKAADEGDFFLARGLISERAGEFFDSVGDRSSSARYLQQAFQCYVDYGAAAKVKQMEEAYGSVITFTNSGPSEHVMKRKVPAYLMMTDLPSENKPIS